LTQMLWLATACEQDGKTALPEEPWSDEAELLFQHAQVLRYEQEQRRLETARLRAQGIEGAPPSLRKKATSNSNSASTTTSQFFHHRKGVSPR